MQRHGDTKQLEWKSEVLQTSAHGVIIHVSQIKIKNKHKHRDTREEQTHSVWKREYACKQSWLSHDWQWQRAGRTMRLWIDGKYCSINFTNLRNEFNSSVVFSVIRSSYVRTFFERNTALGKTRYHCKNTLHAERGKRLRSFPWHVWMFTLLNNMLGVERSCLNGVQRTL